MIFLANIIAANETYSQFQEELWVMLLKKYYPVCMS